MVIGRVKDLTRTALTGEATAGRGEWGVGWERIAVRRHEGTGNQPPDRGMVSGMGRLSMFGAMENRHPAAAPPSSQHTWA
jgi:hypothetical protein